MATNRYRCKVSIKREQTLSRMEKERYSKYKPVRSHLQQAQNPLMIPEIASASTAVTASDLISAGLGYIAAASTGMATIGAGYAVGSVGSAALGAVSEDQKILGKTLIFIWLPERWCTAQFMDL